jgi:hypothetical protein
VVAANTGTGNANELFSASLKNVIAVQSLRQPKSPNQNQANGVVAPGEKILSTLP